LYSGRSQSSSPVLAFLIDSSLATALADSVAKEFLDFGVISQKEDEEILGSILEEEAQGQVAATLEKAVTQLANAHPTVAMRLAEGLGQLYQCEQALDALGLSRCCSS
jgi:hypothetical protein